MRRNISILVFIILLLFAPCDVATAQDVNLPIAELLGGKYYVYTAKKGDTLFGIARKFNWDDARLAELNKNAVSPLKKGMLIYYPVSEEAAEASTPVAKQAPSHGEVKHKIKRGETVYGIANMYGVGVERIYALNPESRNGIKAGETLIIRKAAAPEETSTGNDSDAMIYTVKQGDTLYKLSQTYGVSVAAIMQSNPGVNERNFRAGSTVKIPKKGTGITTHVETVEETNLNGVEMHQVTKDETWTSIARKSGVDVEVLKEANPTVDKLKSKEYIAVPKLETTVSEKEVAYEDPRETTVGGLNEIYDDVHNLMDTEWLEPYRVNVAVVAENPTSRKDAEFLRGFLTGIDRQKRADYKISLKVINAADGAEKVIEALDQFKPTIVFTTNETQLPDYLGEYAYTSRTPVVNTFDVRNEAYSDNPYLVQLLTPSSIFNDNVAHYIHNRFAGYKLLMIGTEDPNDQLAESLLAVWEPSLVKRAPIEKIVPEAFREQGQYLIYGYDVKKGEVSSLLERVAKVRGERPLAEISMLGRPNLILFEETMDEDFKKANLSIPSRFYADKESHEYKEFLQRYKLLFSRQPSKSIPLYAAVGYDTSIYFIPSLAETRGDINQIKPSKHTVQSDYDLWRPSNWSGLLNPPVFVIDYTPLGSIEKNVVSYTE